MAQLPLLIQGLYSNVNGSDNSLVYSGNMISWNNVTKTGRGNVIAIDPMTFTDVLNNYTNGILNLSIGGMLVLQSMPLSLFNVLVHPRSYEILKLSQPGGQTIELLIDDSTDQSPCVIHTYYENHFATPDIIFARDTAVLKQRQLVFTTTPFPGGGRFHGQLFTVPTNIGNVVGVQLLAWSVQGLAYTESTITVMVNGVSIFENCYAALGSFFCSRPGLVFPILIRGGSTIEIQANTDHANNNLIVALRLFMDDDVSATKNYDVPQ